MKVWLISVIAASFLLSSLSSLLPEGSVKRGALTAFGFIFITIIISPVTDFFSQGLPLDSLMVESITETENTGEGYVKEVVEDFESRIEEQCLIMLKENNIEGEITVEVNEDSESESFCEVMLVKCSFYKNKAENEKSFNIEKIVIDFDGVSVETEDSFSDNSEKEKVRKLISDYLSIEKEKVYVESE